MEQSNNQQTQDLSQLRARENPVVLTTAVVHKHEIEDDGSDDVSYEEGEKSNKSSNKKNNNNNNHSTSVELEMKLGDWPDISNEVSMVSSGNNNNNNNNDNDNNNNANKDTRSRADMEDEIRLYQAKINSLKENINHKKHQSSGKSKNDTLDEADDAIYQMSKVNQQMMNENKSKQKSNKSGININLRHNGVSFGDNINRSSPRKFSFMRGGGNNGSNNNGNSNSSSNGNDSGSRPQPSQQSNSYQSPQTQQQTYTHPHPTFTMDENGFGYSYSGIRGSNTYSMNNRFHPFDTQALHMSRIETLAMGSQEVKEKVVAEAAPFALIKVMTGVQDVSPKLFYTQVMRKACLFENIPKGDRSKFMERETPFTNINFPHVMFNVMIGYQSDKLYDEFNRSLNGDDSVTSDQCLKTLGSIRDLVKLERKYYCDKAKHTQKSWCKLIFSIVRDNMQSSTMLQSYERRKDELEKPGQQDYLLSGGNNQHVNMHNAYKNQNKRKHYNNYNNSYNQNYNNNSNNNSNSSNNSYSRSGYGGYTFDPNSAKGKAQIQSVMNVKKLSRKEAIDLLINYQCKRCFAFHNTGICKNFNLCWFSHNCKNCFAEHPEVNCPKCQH